MMDYSELPSLASYYLEDSYVLNIDFPTGELVFRLDLVLTEDHPDYHQPGPDEQYCYVDGSLIFKDVAHLEWVSKNFRTITDAAGEEDMGNIDFLKYSEDHWRVGGDWGEVLVYTSARPEVTLA